MRKKTIGQVLVLARSRQGLAMADLHERMGLPLEFLEAVESDDLDALPGPFYVKKTLAAYAEMLDLDKDILWQAYESGNLLAYDEIEVDSFDNPRSRQVRPKKVSYLPLFYLSMLAFVILLGITYYIWNFKTLHSSSLNSAETYQVVQPFSKEQITSSNQFFSIQTSGSGGQLEVQVSKVDKPVKITLSLKDGTSWVSISNTNFAEGETLSPEKKEISFEASPNQTYLFRLGVVRSIMITIDGQPLDLSPLTANSGMISLTMKQ